MNTKLINELTNDLVMCKICRSNYHRDKKESCNECLVFKRRYFYYSNLFK